MILDPRTMDSKDVYRFIISAVVPRPIAFVSTVSAAGETNLAPFSYYNAVASEPLLDAMVRTAGEWPRSASEFGVSGLTALPSERVRPPYVAESPLQLECVLYKEVPLGNSILVVGEVVLARVRDDVMVDGRVDPAKLAPLARLGGELYAALGPVLKRARPKVSRDTGELAG